MEDGSINLYGFEFNNPLMFIDILGLDPNDKFKTRDEAAKDACKYIFPLTKKNKCEYGGWIIANADGTFTYPAPTTDKKKDSVTMPKKPDSACGN